MSESFGMILKKLRTSRNMSQSDLSTILNVTQQTVAKWENANREPSFDMLCAIADIFHTSADTLLARNRIAEDIIQLNNTEKKLLDTFRQLNNAGRNALMYSASIIAGNPDMQKESEPAQAIS